MRKLRKHYDYTQRQIADKLNVSYQAVSKWENGTNQIDIDTMRRLCSVFDLTSDDFMRIADGVEVSMVLKTAVRQQSEPTPNTERESVILPESKPMSESVPEPKPTHEPTHVAHADDKCIEVAAPPTKKNMETIPAILALCLFAVIVIFTIVTCVTFIPRRKSVLPKTVSVKLMDGDKVFWQKELPFGATITVPSTDKDGYKFDGWYADVELSTAKPLPTTAYADITLYGKWRISNSYTIRFIDYYGRSTMPDLTVKIGESVKLPKSTYKNSDGKQMLYWRTSTGATYEDGDVVKDLAKRDGDVVKLTASWDAICVLLTYDGNGGVSYYHDDDSIEFYSDSQIKIDSTGWHKMGYTLAGWTIDGKLYKNGDWYTSGTHCVANKTAVAVWAPNTYNISYKCYFYDINGNMAWHSECKHKLKTEEFVYDESGYVVYNPYATEHLGYELGDISGMKVGEEYELDMPMTIDFRVNWYPKSYDNVTIEIENDEGMQTYKNVYSWVYATDIEEEVRNLIGNEIQKKSGHTVDECTVYLNGEEYDGDYKYITTDEDDEIRICFTQTMNSYDLTLSGYYDNSGIGAKIIDEATLQYDEEYTLPTPPARVGYKFDGWKIGDELYEAGTVVSKLAEYGSINVTIQWTAIQYGITFDVDGDAELVTPQIVKYDEKFKMPKCPISKSDYVFMGWECNDKAYPADLQVSNITVVDNALLTFTAKWCEPYKGRGTEESPYRVDSYEQLFNLYLFAMQGTNNKAYYRLTADVDCENKSLYPIDGFSGVFDGDFHTVSNAKLNAGYFDSTANMVGLFGSMYGTVKNIGIDNYSINATNCKYVGALAAMVSGKGVVSQVWTSGNIVVKSNGYCYFGGLIGEFSGGTATNCYSDGTMAVTAVTDEFCKFCVGGLVGSLGFTSSFTKSMATVEHCYANVKIDINADGADVAGLVGAVDYGTVNSSFVMGSITAVGESFYAEWGQMLYPRSSVFTDGFVYACDGYTVVANNQTVAPSSSVKRTALSNLCSAQWIESNLEFDTDSVWKVIDELPKLAGFQKGDNV
ncbi:MAG: InlB B-repeat-containing protein [Clostridiales bacterium]|nr:InlB B-repeat-containing protein [Clostridiales bacterium]